MSTSLNEQLAAELYEAYRTKIGGKAFDGAPLPNSKEFFSDPRKKPQAEAWLTVAQTARTRIAQEIAAAAH